LVSSQFRQLGTRLARFMEAGSMLVFSPHIAAARSPYTNPWRRDAPCESPGLARSIVVELLALGLICEAGNGKSLDHPRVSISRRNAYHPGSGRKEASAAMKRGLKVGRRSGYRYQEEMEVCVCVCVLDGRVERTYLVGRGGSRGREREGRSINPRPGNERLRG
jgi:hypothetical protein